MHSLAIPDQWRHSVAAQMEELPFLTKVENQMLKKGKSANCNEHPNQNNQSCLHKNQNRDLKKSQNHKTENSSTPLPRVSDGL